MTERVMNLEAYAKRSAARLPEVLEILEKSLSFPVGQAEESSMTEIRKVIANLAVPLAACFGASSEFDALDPVVFSFADAHDGSELMGLATLLLDSGIPIEDSLRLQCASLFRDMAFLLNQENLVLWLDRLDAQT